MASDGIRSQDVLLLLKIVSLGGDDWRGIDLANAIGISPSQVSLGLERACRSGLMDHKKKRVLREPFLEFILHGLKYVFPAEPGPIRRGIATAHSAPPLVAAIVSSANDQYVWPDVDGDLRGQAIEPLYPSAPQAAKRDQRLYELLALIDALRVGRARERNIAREELERRIKGPSYAGK